MSTTGAEQKEERWFPIQPDFELGYGRIRIPWSLAEKAYENYSCKSSQSLERIAERGGFGLAELVWLLAGGKTGQNWLQMQRQGRTEWR